MATIYRFEDLEVWQLARALENELFALTNPGDFKNDFDLIRQMRRASGSVMDNIAEGFGRASRLEFVNALGIAKGETSELQSQLYRATDRQYISEQSRLELHTKADTIATKIAAFMAYLNKSEIKGQKFQNRIP